MSVDDIRSVSGCPFDRCVEKLLPGLCPVPEYLVQAVESGERVSVERLHGRLYDGVSEGLTRLSSVYPLFLVSNCPAWYLDEFLSFTGLGEHFTACDCHGRSGVGKAEMLSGMLRRFGLKSAVYVGDTQGDHDAAKAAGLEFAFANYGFGSVEGARHKFATFAGLVEYFMAHSPG